jgi:phosphoribosyl 1,2-cyclic phosphate phosphodiesterase
MLEYDGRVVVIDTTPDFRTQVLRENLQRLDAIVFTHAHVDHVMGLDDVRAYCFLQNAPIPIYADAHTMDNIRRIFTYIFDANYPYGGIPKLDPHLIDGPFDLWGQSFMPVPVLHGRLPVLGFRFGRAAYLTDFSTIPESSMALLEGLDVLVLDALRHKLHPTHSNVEQSLALARRLKPKQTYFTHIAHEMGHGEANATLPPGVQLAYDGLSVEF